MAKRGRRSNNEGSMYFDSTNDRWVAQISLPNGKRRTKSGKDRVKVLDWLTEQRDKVRRGTYITDESLKLGPFLLSYMENVAVHKVRPRTYETHYGYTVNHIVPELGHIKLTSLRPDHVQAFYSKKLSEGLAPRTVQYMHSILHKALDQALRWGHVSRNVTDLVDAPRPQSKPPVIWNPNDIREFLTATEGHIYYPIYVSAIYLGMREAEILGIHKADVNLEKGIVHVKHQVQRIRGKGLTVTDVKTEKSRRAITIPPFALNVLKEHLNGVESGLIFTTRTGNPVDAHNLYRHFKATIKKLGLPDIRFHDLRHTHASLLLSEGVHPKVVQERLGHSQISTTIDIYSHTVPGLQEEAAFKFEEALS